MAVSKSFLDFAAELFEPFGEVTIRKMFGAAGVYCDSLFFAVLDDEVVYLKTDETTRAEFERAGCLPFSFETKDGEIAVMSYYAAPGDFYDDAEETRRWTTLALDAARRAAKLKKKRVKKATTAPKRAKAGR